MKKKFVPEIDVKISENNISSASQRWVCVGEQSQQHTMGTETVECPEDVKEVIAECKFEKTGVTSLRTKQALRLLDQFLTGRRFTRGDIQIECEHQDANQVLHVLRNEMCVPISCQRGKNGMPTLWFMTQEDIDSFHSNRDEQVQNQKVKIAESLETKKEKLIMRWLDDEGEEKLIKQIKELAE